MMPPVNRRKAERRRGDRRRPPLPNSDAAWLGSRFEASTHAASQADAALLDTDPDAAADAQPTARSARRARRQEGAALPRILRTYLAARAALSLALVLAPWLGSLGGGKPPVLVVLVCLAYASQAVSLWLLRSGRDDPPPGHLPRQPWLLTIGVDLVAFSALRMLDAQAPLNYTALLVLPVLMAGVLSRREVALATAAALSLGLILAVWPMAADGADMALLLSQAGLAGAGLFLIALVASELAQRLAREEQAARSSLEMARQQTQLNRLVIEEMADGVLVVDRRARLRALNPAGRLLLGEAGKVQDLPRPLAELPGLQPLQHALQQAYAEGRWPATARELSLRLASGEQRTLQVRARFARRSGLGDDGMPPEDLCVLFVEDLRVVQARARQDKLAAMGRVSAGIAHEIRNPLAAIAQANALLREDVLEPAHQRLATIVTDNVARLQRIVDDVLAVAPGAAVPSAVIDACAETRQVAEEWRRAQPGPAAALETRLEISHPAQPLLVQFDAEHLRRVLTNLLDNAQRHATPAAGAIRVRLATGPAAGMVTLAVASDGPPIAPDVERHLFEPFFSTRSRGSGLGLYICRELCERHGGGIEFSLSPPGARHRNVFNVTMRSALPNGTPAASGTSTATGTAPPPSA